MATSVFDYPLSSHFDEMDSLLSPGTTRSPRLPCTSLGSPRRRLLIKLNVIVFEIVHPEDGRLIPFDTYNLFYRDDREQTVLARLRAFEEQRAGNLIDVIPAEFLALGVNDA